MEHRPIQMLFGDLAIGLIGEGIGSGFEAIGPDLHGHMPIGYPVIGSREEEVGSGSMVIGSTDKLKVKSDEF
jgi:hypothetical protein